MRDSVSDVLKAIAISGPISRAQLARELGFSGPTLTLATKQLIERGLVMEVEQALSTGGRPPTLLGLVPGAGQVLGIKLAEDHLVGVCVDLESQPLWSFEEQFSSRGEQALEALVSILRKQISKVQGQILGIGIGFPGVVSSVDSVTASSTILDWADLNVGDQISSALGVPVILENDVNTLAVTESLFGKGKDVSNFLTVTLGRGIGLGIVINGELYNGTRGAGEFGHTYVVGQIEQCECGKFGCLETVAAEPAILSSAIRKKIITKNDSIQSLYAALQSNEELNAEILGAPGKALGIALGNVINILGPELVLVSGEGSEAWHLWERFVIPVIEQTVVPIMRNFDIEIDPWDDKKWAMGAASLVLQASLNRSSIGAPAMQAVKNRLRVLPGALAI